MNVSLTPELEKWVQAKVETGLYGSASEVVRDALRLLHQFDDARARRLGELRAELLIGMGELRSGQSEPFTESIVARIKESGRRKLNA